MLGACVSLFSFLALAASGQKANQLEKVDVRAAPGKMEIRLDTSAPPTFQSYTRRSPAILIVDLVNTAARNQTFASPVEGVEEISVEARNDGATPTSRLWVRLKKTSAYDVEAVGNQVKITIFNEGKILPATGSVKSGNAAAFVAPSSAARVAMRGGTTTAATKNASDVWVGQGTRLAQLDPEDESLESSTAEDEALSDIDPTDEAPETMPTGDGEGAMGMSTGMAAEGEVAMTYIGFVNRATESEIFARMSQRTGFEVRREGDNLMVLEIPRATIPLRNNKNHLDTTFFESPVKMITPTVVDDDETMIRIIIEMKEEVPYESNLQGNDIVIRFKR